LGPGELITHLDGRFRADLIRHHGVTAVSQRLHPLRAEGGVTRTQDIGAQPPADVVALWRTREVT
jgi:hypothetical protein